MMDYNMRGEVLRHFKRLGARKTLTCGYTRDDMVKGGNTYTYTFRDAMSDEEIVKYSIVFNDGLDIFDTVQNIEEDLEKRIKARNEAIGGYASYSKQDVKNTQDLDAFWAAYQANGTRANYSYAFGISGRRSGRFPYGWFIPHIKDVIFNDPATIVFWDDGTKTVVKAQGDDIFDPEKGLAMAITKKAFGNQGNYCEKIKPWLTGCDKQENTANKNNKIKAVRYMLVNAMDLNKTKAAMRETINEAIHALGECVDN